VGDLLFVSKNESLPSDMLILASSAHQGMCYVSTMNLDGETNLKPRRALLEHHEYDADSYVFKHEINQYYRCSTVDTSKAD
jgi:magnesium-transporting ATPase (P-type)